MHTRLLRIEVGQYQMTKRSGTVVIPLCCLWCIIFLCITCLETALAVFSMVKQYVHSMTQQLHFQIYTHKYVHV